jgi:hypothetical protein
MTAREDIERAADEARAQVRDARAALAASREARGGGAAKDVRQAEAQLLALRDAVAGDARALRDRLAGLDGSARRGVGTIAVAGAGALATLVGGGLMVRGRVRRGVADRGVQRQASAIAAALARELVQPAGAARAPRESGGRRRGRAALIAAVVTGAVVAGRVVAEQRRSAPVDPEDLWLPERGTAPA